MGMGMVLVFGPLEFPRGVAQFIEFPGVKLYFLKNFQGKVTNQKISGFFFLIYALNSPIWIFSAIRIGHLGSLRDLSSA